MAQTATTVLEGTTEGKKLAVWSMYTTKSWAVVEEWHSTVATAGGEETEATANQHSLFP